MTARRHVTVVVPLYRSAATVRELAERLHRALDPLPEWSWDLVLVDDACPEGSGAAARELAAEDSAVRLVTHRSNRGQHRAVLTGLAFLGKQGPRADWAVVMDGDLQDRPEDVPRLLAAAISSPAEAVFGGRRGRYESPGRRLSSWGFRRLRHWTAGVPLDAGLFVALSRRMREAMAALDDAQPSVVMMIGLTGLPLLSIPIERSHREHGRSAYRGRMRLDVALNALRFTLHRRLLGRGRGRPPALEELVYEVGADCDESGADSSKSPRDEVGADSYGPAQPPEKTGNREAESRAEDPLSESGADPYESGATSPESSRDEVGATSNLERDEVGADSQESGADSNSGPNRLVAGLGVLAAVALLYELVNRLAPPPPFEVGDEGFRFLLSDAWARGSHLFERFQLLYLPGEYAWYGSWLGVFGSSIPVLRASGRGLAVLAILVLWAAARSGVGGTAGPGGREHERRRAWIAAGLAAALAVGAVPAPKTLAAALVVAASLPLFRRKSPSRGDLLSAAALAGFLAGVREDSAVLAGLLAVGLAVRRSLPSGDAPSDPASSTVRALLRDLWRRTLPTVTAGALTGFLPWIVLFAARGEPGGLLSHLGHRLVFLVTRLGDPSEVPAAAPEVLATAAWWRPEGGWTVDAVGAALLPTARLLIPAWYLGLFAWVAAARFRARRRDRPWTGRPSTERQRGILAAAVLGVAYLPQFVWERPDLAHLRDHAAVLLTGLALIAGAASSEEGKRRLGRFRPGVAGAVLGLFVLVFIAGVGAKVLGSDRYPAVPYPTPAGRAIEAGVPPPAPAWAGLPREPGDTLIVLTWGAGWYALEGMEPGTRHLSTYLRHTDHPETVAELRADLARPTNRWVILHRRGEVPAAVRERVGELYGKRERWRGWEVWERRRDRPESAHREPGAPE